MQRTLDTARAKIEDLVAVGHQERSAAYGDQRQFASAGLHPIDESERVELGVPIKIVAASAGQPAGRNDNPNADREAPLCRGDHVAFAAEMIAAPCLSVLCVTGQVA